MGVESIMRSRMRAMHERVGVQATAMIDGIPAQIYIVRQTDFEIESMEYETFRAVYDDVRCITTGDSVVIMDEMSEFGEREVVVVNAKQSDDGLEMIIAVKDVT